MVAQSAASQGPAAEVRQLLADLIAGSGPCVPALDQALSASIDERLHPGHLATKYLRHLGLREIADLHQEQGRALLGRELRDVAEQLTHLGSPLHLIGEPGGRKLHIFGHLVVRTAEERDAAVAGDREEPGLEGDLTFPSGSPE